MGNDVASVQDTIPDIAIVGLAGRFPGACDVDKYWENLRSGVGSISFFSDEDLRAAGVDAALLNDPHYVKAAPVLEHADQFDAQLFGYTPREARALDPQHRLFLECAWEALEYAGYNPRKYDRPIGVYGGSALNTYLLFSGLLPRFHDEYLLILLGNDKDFLATRVSYKLDLRGPSVTVQTACSTSLVAIHLACQSLRHEECDMALAGGVSVRVPQIAGYLHQEGGILSPDGHCRTFDAKAKGTIFGSGVGVVVLKRLPEALADGDFIHAVIKGSAINNDGASKVEFTAPSVSGQAEAVVEALAYAGIDVETLSYVEAHGTGTPLGDPIEIAALSKAFRVFTPKKNFCAIGSVKTNIGHLDAAAGVAGLIKTVLALKHQWIPASLHYEEPNPEIDFADSPFSVNTVLTEWTARPAPRRAGINSLGMGGTNAFVVLEEAPPVRTSGAARSEQLLLLSAKSGLALDEMASRLAEHLDRHREAPLADVAYTLQVGRKDLDHRRMLVCRDRAEAVAALRSSGAGRAATAQRRPVARDMTFLFPGQGSQFGNSSDTPGLRSPRCPLSSS
jgi:acyl transferase domain-containing protein